MVLNAEEKIRKIESAIAGARTPKQKCSLLIDKAMELRHINPSSALKAAEEALSVAEEIGFAVGRARSSFCIGLVHFNFSDYEKAFIYLDRSNHLFQAAGDKWGVSNSLNNIGLIYLRLGEFPKALGYFSSSLEIKQDSGDRFGTANVMISMAAIHRETDQLRGGAATSE
jgi:tetratricopeptide (TPR) repeat protein